MARIHQEFQTLGTVASYALGGKKKSGTTVDEANVPKNIDDAKRKLAAVFGKG
jgi:hypothetical protein